VLLIGFGLLVQEIPANQESISEGLLLLVDQLGVLLIGFGLLVPIRKQNQLPKKTYPCLLVWFIGSVMQPIFPSNWFLVHWFTILFEPKTN